MHTSWYPRCSCPPPKLHSSFPPAEVATLSQHAFWSPCDDCSWTAAGPRCSPWKIGEDWPPKGADSVEGWKPWGATFELMFLHVLTCSYSSVSALVFFDEFNEHEFAGDVTDSSHVLKGWSHGPHFRSLTWQLPLASCFDGPRRCLFSSHGVKSEPQGPLWIFGPKPWCRPLCRCAALAQQIKQKNSEKLTTCLLACGCEKSLRKMQQKITNFI